MTPEFSRPFDVRHVEGLHVRLEPDAAERAALARRFGLVSVDSLAADLDLACRQRAGGFQIEASGVLTAQIVQSCAVSAEDLPVTVNEPLFFRFVPQSTTYAADEEVELTAEELDEIEYEGTHFDLGEAVAQSLALAIDPFLVGPQAEAARRAAGIGIPEDASPFAALKGLKLGKD
ncbi:YceD family protein [Novosphingobium sp. Leaf2]|uniref:YceD family protein n=1 Tax=Novosphingobium sp. Leaf2 TaxID=1735670 RepID=UPI0006F4D471|nr:YceD family protein [Novosphingobium sp. Leaf2]KQM18687.1 DNA-binding protein [Novosphingobium sp. Leaf2]